jgi:hypothetical protein
MPRRNSGPRLRFLDKRGVYYIVWSERGRSRERSTGTPDRQQAQIKLAEFLQQRDRRAGPRHPNEILVTALLNEYATERGPKVAAQDRIAYAVLALTDFFEGNSLADVTPQTCARYAEKRRRSAGTVRRELGVLRAAINYAHRNGRITRPVAVASDATKATHGAQRELFKQCVLAVLYGMEANSLALRIGQPPIVARDLLRSHHEVFRTFWSWSDAAVDQAMLHGSIHTVFGWHVRVGENPNPRSLRNFPVQGNGSEMLRIACCLATEREIEVCAPVHDAVLICAPLERLEADIATTRSAMAEASRAVLGGFELRTDVSITKWPDRYMDPRGAVMWNRVTKLLRQPDQEQQQTA